MRPQQDERINYNDEYIDEDDLDEEMDEEKAQAIDSYFRPSATEVNDEVEVVEMLNSIDSEWRAVMPR